jgi:hypothetical protein
MSNLTYNMDNIQNYLCHSHFLYQQLKDLSTKRWIHDRADKQFNVPVMVNQIIRYENGHI